MGTSVRGFFVDFDKFIPEIIQRTWESIYMVGLSTLFSCLFGIALGVLLVISSKNGIKPMPTFHSVLGWIVNIGRSIPFIILMIAIMPLSRFLLGTAIGLGSAVFALVVAATPFVARVAETSFLEVDSGLIEAAQSMGSSPSQIIFKVMLPESVPSLLLGVSLTAITLVGYSAIVGVIGAGGLGDLAIVYGYQRYQGDIMLVAVIILIVLVQLIQTFFNILVRRLDKRLK